MGTDSNDDNRVPGSRLILAFALFGGALLVILGRFVWYFTDGNSAAYKETGGGAAAAAAILLLVALIVWRPSLIMDDAPDQGGEPSTMRILALAVVVTFCIIMLRTAWDTNALPPLKDQGNWVWLVTAALGGKALQKYAEVQQKTEEIKQSGTHPKPDQPKPDQAKGVAGGAGQKGI